MLPFPARTSPIRFLALLLLVACDGGKAPPAAEPAAPGANSTLGDLLANSPDPAPVPTPTPRPTAPVETTAKAPAATANADAAADTPECNAARAAYKQARAHVETQRVQLTVPAEESMNRAQAAFSACMSSPLCTSDGEQTSKAKSAADLSIARYQAALEQVGVVEASLYPLDQAVERACGRQ